MQEINGIVVNLYHFLKMLAFKNSIFWLQCKAFGTGVELSVLSSVCFGSKSQQLSTHSSMSLYPQCRPETF